jgi:hypothetical protein
MVLERPNAVAPGETRGVQSTLMTLTGCAVAVVASVNASAVARRATPQWLRNPPV